jgi:hypothetical protein
MYDTKAYSELLPKVVLAHLAEFKTQEIANALKTMVDHKREK